MFAIFGALVAIQIAFLLGLRHEVTAGRAALTDARRALTAGDLEQSERAFGSAEIDFQRAVDAEHGGLGTVARAIPWLGNSANTVTAMSEAGLSLSRAGADVTATLAALPDGVGSLMPAGGQLPIQRYADLAATLASARDETASALTALEGAPESFVPRTLQRALWDALEQTRHLDEVLRGISLLADGTSSFAGADGPRRYLVVAQNPAELRGTGGIWGAYAILTLDGGQARVSHAHPTQTLRDFPSGRVPSPSQDYARNYDQYGGAGSWQNMNATPDFPSAAQAALANYLLGEGTALDGVIAADPFALQSFLAVTGPVAVPGSGTLTADNVVDVTTNRAYAKYSGATERKEVLGGAASEVLARFLAMDDRAIGRLKAFATAVFAGHLRIFSTDETTQQGLAALEVDGSLGMSDGDVVAVTVNNGSGSKVDYYADRTVDYDVQLGGDHEAISTATVSIANHAPTDGQPRYVIGPLLPDAHAGDQIPVVQVSCHAPCELEAASRDGVDTAVAVGSENGLPWLRDYRTIRAGSSGSLSLTWRAENVWDGNSSGGTYQLRYVGQTTIRPTDLHVTIHAPSGTRIVWTSVPMVVDGGTATWEGTSNGITELSVRFQAPLPLRLLRDVTRPVVGD